MAEEVKIKSNSDDSQESGLRIYEVGYHIIPTVKEEDIEAIVNSIRTVIERAGGSFITEGAPVSMKLSYAMTAREGDKNVEYDRGYFGWIKFESSIEAAESLNQMLTSDRTILRHIIFRTVREETRARMKIPTLREVRRPEALKAAPRHIEDTSIPVSEVDLDKAIETLTTD
ncbi:MAG TPA: 30S ribosomal protein S6 [Candidatus Paceibacterota bacterium]|nr:30S ribosomal protein S6 [Candidatus Paceibacterota bacterium]